MKQKNSQNTGSVQSQAPFVSKSGGLSDPDQPKTGVISKPVSQTTAAQPQKQEPKGKIASYN